ncbi:MAG: LamG domain-containing protein [Candidatus Poribacteria bacterium]|nr:LamG domain-containing protein [Candidatus Poribacteria bacterium]
MYRIIFSLLIITGLLVMPFHALALNLKDKELLLYFSFDNDKENAVKDLSPHGNDGEIVGAAEFVDGKIGQALKFAGNAEVKAPHIPLNDKSFTVTLWAKPMLTGGDQQCVFTQTQVNGANTSLHYRIYNNGTVRMGFYGNDLDAPAGAVKADEWAHICFWLDADEKTRRVYINGEQKAEDKDKSLYKGTAGDTMVGSWGPNGQKFNGLIDVVMVWDRALSEAEIKQSMEPGAAAVDPNAKLATTWANVKGSQ